MKYIAFFATQTPTPGKSYAGITVDGETVFIRGADVSDHASPLGAAEEMALPGETLLNTFETDE